MKRLPSFLHFGDTYCSDGTNRDLNVLQGVPTGLTDFAWQILQKAAPDLIPKINDAVPQFANGKFGIFKGKNDTVKDMFYRVNNDVGSCEFMQILEFNGKASLNDFWWPDVGRTPSAVCACIHLFDWFFRSIQNNTFLD